MEAFNDSASITPELISFSNGSENGTTSFPPGGRQGQVSPFPLWYGCIYAFFVSLGFVTNTLCFLVMQTASLKGLTISVYLSCLAIVDFMVQGSELFNLAQLTFMIRPPHVFSSCVTLRVLIDGLLSASNWILAAVSFERFYFVFFPVTARYICTVQKARVISCSVIVASFLCRFSCIYTVELDKNSFCRHREDTFFSKTVQPILEALLITIFPAIIITACNVLIAIKIQQKRQLMKPHKSNGKDHNVPAGNGESHRDSRDQKVMLMLLMVSLSFLVLCLPNSILHIVFLSGFQGPQSQVLFYIRIVSFMMSKLNNSVNFFVYVLSSSDFRREFIQGLARSCPRCK